MNDVSIDIETLGTRFDAPIISIGAALFDRSTGEIGDGLYVAVDMEDALRNGRPSGSTLKWWLRQSQLATAVFDDDGAIPLGAALNELGSFLRVYDAPTLRVWGNGATFDVTILEHAFAQCIVEPPWSFWNIRDMRTLVDAAAEIGFNRSSIEFEGIAHNALHDARHQGRVISACWNIVVKRKSSEDPS